MAIVPFLVVAIIRASPPKKAIKISLISGLVRANNSEVSALMSKIQKYTKEVRTLSNIIVPRLINEVFKVSMSFIAIDRPTPKIGPIKGEINIAPITTGIELVFSPIEATKIEQIRIQAVAPLNWILAFISSIVLI